MVDGDLVLGVDPPDAEGLVDNVVTVSGVSGVASAWASGDGRGRGAAAGR